jgi:hypothetical protein
MTVNRIRPSLDLSHNIITKIVLQKILLIFGKICHIQTVRSDSHLQTPNDTDQVRGILQKWG